METADAAATQDAGSQATTAPANDVEVGEQTGTAAGVAETASPGPVDWFGASAPSWLKDPAGLGQAPLAIGPEDLEKLPLEARMVVHALYQQIAGQSTVAQQAAQAALAQQREAQEAAALTQAESSQLWAVLKEAREATAAKASAATELPDIYTEEGLTARIEQIAEEKAEARLAAYFGKVEEKVQARNNEAAKAQTEATRATRRTELEQWAASKVDLPIYRAEISRLVAKDQIIPRAEDAYNYLVDLASTPELKEASEGFIRTHKLSPADALALARVRAGASGTTQRMGSKRSYEMPTGSVAEITAKLRADPALMQWVLDHPNG